MKKYASYEAATRMYIEYTEEIPTVDHMNEIYHKYRLVWKHFNGFTDWMFNEGY